MVWGACGAPKPPPPSARRRPRPSRHSPRRPPGRGRGNRSGESCRASDLLSYVLATRSPADSASRRPRTWLRRWVAEGGRERAGGRGGADLVTPGGLRGSLSGRETPSPLLARLANEKPLRPLPRLGPGTPTVRSGGRGQLGGGAQPRGSERLESGREPLGEPRTL